MNAPQCYALCIIASIVVMNMMSLEVIFKFNFPSCHNNMDSTQMCQVKCQ